MNGFLDRLQKEQREKEILSEYACFSCDATRKNKSDKCEIRTEFQKDRDKIIHSKSFRRLKHKTQVFLSPEGDHYRTRLTHTLEVSQIARTISSSLRLNEDLTEAIALGHDLGHTPFGHAGEMALRQVKPDFEHNVHSLRIVEHLENSTGLNLTYQVRDGILNHKKRLKPKTLEGMVVNFSDRIAYINHDIDDSIRAGVISADDLPKDCVEIIGSTHSDRIESLILDIVKTSDKEINMSNDMLIAFDKLRAFMFESVYKNPKAKSQEGKAQGILLALYEYYMKKPHKLPESVVDTIEIYGKEQAIIDYIASMTDRYAIKIYSDIFIPIVWSKY